MKQFDGDAKMEDEEIEKMKKNEMDMSKLDEVLGVDTGAASRQPQSNLDNAKAWLHSTGEMILVFKNGRAYGRQVLHRFQLTMDELDEIFDVHMKMPKENLAMLAAPSGGAENKSYRQVAYQNQKALWEGERKLIGALYLLGVSLGNIASLFCVAKPTIRDRLKRALPYEEERLKGSSTMAEAISWKEAYKANVHMLAQMDPRSIALWLFNNSQEFQDIDDGPSAIA